MAEPASVGAQERWAPLAWLREALALLEGGAFFFVVDPAGRPSPEGKEALGHILGDRPLVEVRLSPERSLDLHELKERLAPDRRSVVLLDAVDLEWADLEVTLEGPLAERIQGARRVLQDLNLKREALARLGAPVVFWVTPAGLRAFSLWAADLFSAHSGVFEVAPAPSPVEVELLTKSIEPEPWAEADRLRNLPEAEVRGRIRLYERQLEKEARKRTPHRPRLAVLHMGLALLHWHLGDHLRALEHQQKAVNLYRQLAARNPQAYRRDLAGSLTILGAVLFAMGRREEALAATQEAVGLYRELAVQNPQDYRPALARSLTDLGNILLVLDRDPEALAATQEAVGLYRELAAQNPQAYRPALAGSLTTLGLRLSALGRWKEALAATQEAVGLYRELAAQNPQDYRPDLSHSLGAHGTMLLALGRPTEAVEAFGEGLRAIAPFVRDLPQAFGDLAAYLLQGYLRASQEAGREPDEGLVGPVREVLGRQGEGQEGKGSAG